MNKIMAIGLTSGGLDSMLAALLLKKQDLDVLLVCFTTPFFSERHARRSAQATGLPLKVVDITREHLSMLRNPPHGYGTNMNPCIDCHALMVRKAGEIMEQEGASFVFTGEVLGQRPFSQNRAALRTVARESGLEDLLLRPLSAKLLPPTTPEKQGWVDRERLLDLQGRSRKRQMALARELGFTDYPSPAGGCLLTEEVFSRRLKDLFLHQEEVEVREIELLKLGRHFRLDHGAKLVVGRNKRENEIIRALARPQDQLFVCREYPGPTGLAPGGRAMEDKSRELAACICASYSDAPDQAPVQVLAQSGPHTQLLTVVKQAKESLRSLMI